MPNIASVFKAEIARIARKEAKHLIDPLRKTNATLRSEVASLKRKIVDQDRALAALAKSRSTKAASVPAETGREPATKHRITANGVKSLRGKLGLTAEQLGALVGVSGQTVYLWEHGKTSPRPKPLAGLAKLRTMGKKEVSALFAR